MNYFSLALLLVTLACSQFSCKQKNVSQFNKKRVIVLGFDGLDYNLTKELMDAGKMPNFSLVASSGEFSPLETSVPVQSPVAWSNFITGMDSGGHGIFDFLHRDPSSLLPFLSTGQASAPGKNIKIGKYQFPLTAGSIDLLRKGRAFWEVLENKGIETTIIRMPANFPPSGTASRELSGMGTPDLSGTLGEFSFYTSKLFAFAGADIAGGNVYEVDIFDGVVNARLYGPDNPFLVDPEQLSTAFTTYIDPSDPVVKIVIGNQELLLKEGEFSPWTPVEFTMFPTQTLSGIVRFYLRSAHPELELYVSPINFDPLRPAIPISTPKEYAAELATATGRFYTQGMPEDTKVLQEGVLTTDEFLAQAAIAGQELFKQYEFVLNEFDQGFLFYYTGNVDQISHIMWKTRDPEHPAYDPEKDAKYSNLIENLYIELDKMVETTLKHMDDDTTLIIMSDHGFTSWRRSFHLNTWLKEKGYLVVKDPNMENDPGMFINIDWSQTQAYGVGINGLYINVRGRERNGIVSPERRKKIIDAISEDLLAEIDPVTGLQAVTKVYKRDEFYEDRKELEIGPDIIVGYAKGTRCSGHSALGGVGTKVFTNNTDEWSGDHEMDHRTVPGVLLTSRKLKKPAPRIQDLAASILAEFNINEPVQLQ